MDKREKAYAALDKFVGRWKTAGLIPPTPTSPAVHVNGTDTYEWLSGRFFLQHKVDVLMGQDRNETLEIIGYDDANACFTMQHYDNRGGSGLMIATWAEASWTFTSDTLRFSGQFNPAGDVFSGEWQQALVPGEWSHFMDICLTKEGPLRNRHAHDTGAERREIP